MRANFLHITALYEMELPDQDQYCEQTREGIRVANIKKINFVQLEGNLCLLFRCDQRIPEHIQ
jgi:hypothetical protein